MHLVRDLLDKQLVDLHDNKIGQVDGIVIELSDGRQPQVSAIETGSGVVLDRLGWRTNSRRYRIPYSKVRDVGVDVSIDIDRQEMPIEKWQEWLRRHVLRWIPGGMS
ncbi:PRC-barrel domain-containing protein [Agrobacterium vitis]|uniref:PRC-barrel domain-containing protein n=1 Tax=Agrobacterium vitis TaxID=373 RepID=UPI0012E76197|nr:hypothetical protein [Agrobacterium vitis]MVA37771.1 hypothetical protein [Agrobacterium vitis]